MSSKRSLKQAIFAVIRTSTLVIVSVCLTLAALELAMRAIDGVSMTEFPNYIVRQLDLIRGNNGAIVYDAILGWRLKDNIGGTGFSTGPYGLRMNSNEIRDPPQGAILAVGDSFTAGSGVDNSDSWPAQLEKITSVPVLNAASGGWSVGQMLLRAENLVPILHPSAIIIGILSQDILRDAYDLYGGAYKPWFSTENGQAKLEGVPVPEIAAKPMKLDTLHTILGHSYLVHTLMERFAKQWWLADHMRYRRALSNEAAVASVCALMDRIIKLRENSGAPVSLVFFWGAGEVMTDPPAWFVTRVIDCAEQKKLPMLDLYGILRKIGQEEPERFKTLWIDEGGVLGHPSATANILTATLIKERFFH